MVTTAPYGSWRSPITADLITAGSVGLSSPAIDGGILYWLESRADQGGRTSLWRKAGDADPCELTPDDDVRATVHEYGGRAYAVAGGVLVYSRFPSNEVVVRIGDGEPRALASDPDHRYAGFVLSDLGFVLAIREDHGVEGEPVSSVVALRLSDGDETVLVDGSDFHDAIALGADGRVAWVAWDHPNMPWDTTRVLAGRFVAAGGRPRILDVQTVCDEPDVAAGRPQWFPDTDLCYVSDASGFWNFLAWNGTDSAPLHRLEADVVGPAWTVGGGGYAVIDDVSLACAPFERGHQRPALLAHGQVQPLAGAANTVHAIAAADHIVFCHLGFPDRPDALAVYDLATGAWTGVRESAEPVDPAYVSVAEAHTFGEPEAYAWFYPPKNPDFRAPEGELPPLRVLSHGGPTAHASAEMDLRIQYWTTRGYAVVDVNYGGSTGHGRAYRERLVGQWGIVDVRDCVAAARHLADTGRVDPRRTMIEGGSAGGYTTLRALTVTDAFAAGVSYYGVADLGALARDTHKFESRYLDPLVTGLDGRPEYAERSPLNHLDRLATPMLILQGTEDRVVPPNQAEMMADAVRAKGLPVALVMFPGEQHGFRQAASIRRSLEATQSFLAQLFGFTPADQIAPLEIENL